MISSFLYHVRQLEKKSLVIFTVVPSYCGQGVRPIFNVSSAPDVRKTRRTFPRFPLSRSWLFGTFFVCLFACLFVCLFACLSFAPYPVSDFVFLLFLFVRLFVGLFVGLFFKYLLV